jgi:hypothetical protein
MKMHWITDTLNQPPKGLHSNQRDASKFEPRFLMRADIVDCALEILSRPNIFDQVNFHYQELLEGSGPHQRRVYGQPWTANWWKKAQDTIGRGSKLLGLTFFSDGETARNS